MHVLDKDQANESDEDNVIYAFSNGQLTQLDRIRTGVLPLPDGNPLDLYVFVPDSIDPKSIVPEPIPLAAISTSDPKESYYLAACGFPNTRNRIKGKELSNRPYGYFGKTAPDHATTSNGYDPRFHFSIDINLKKSFRGELKEIIAPNPQGISGGPVFLVHDFEKNHAIDCMFSGIVIARGKNSKSLICIRPSVVAEIALTLFPPSDSPILPLPM